MAYQPSLRLRRLRQQPQIRQLIRETELSVRDFVQPLFITHERNARRHIDSMPGQYQLGLDHLSAEIDEITARGIPAVMLFGLPSQKDAQGSSAWEDEGIVQQAIRHIKQMAPDLYIISDMCFCEYTDHGHCGVIETTPYGPDVANDATLELLVRQSVSHARAGTHMIAPSGNMDGMVAAIREGLDAAGFNHLPILSYSVKYASSFYGPFREAAEGAPQFGDRKTYQLDPANGQEALREHSLDVDEGADILMVKPAGPYLDVIANTKQHFPEVPLAAYQVSGEYSMIKAAAQQGWLDEKNVVLESLTAIKRAGADFIITYFAKDAADYLA